ncbi:MAG: FlgD immunoglobulin-like domain containing protein, partial [Candidatus Latescibacteria bacterium]|nr:FlgD immunoglobulin-like domain containing protein [Candidatus Latescibacterota bacterium]
ITVLDAGGMMMDETMFPTAAGETTITLYASGKGASGTATIYAVAGADTTNTIVVGFSRENPVELASFAGELVEDGVMLVWTTASQTNNAGWRMLRSVDGENYEVVSGLLPGAGTTDALLNYSFVDKELPASEVVFYVLEQIDLDGAIHRSNEIEVILGARTLPLPTEFGVNAYPNPFNPSTTISYDLPEAQMVSIVIYDALGQEVRRLVNAQTAAGRYQVQWDARDNQGRSVGSGVYIAQVEAGSFSTSQKMLLLK